jgi:endonuclease YncB( thermonuclease family)
MRRVELRNRGGVPFLTLKGIFLVRMRQQPDGDTIAFAATEEFDPGPVESEVPLDDTGRTSVNIRLQSIDAPEKAQPMGAASRDALLRALGIDPAAIGLGDADFVANGDTAIVEGWIATHGIDTNERQLGYVYAEDPGFTHGEVVAASAILATLDRSLNHRQVATGQAFPAFYSNTDETHAVLFQEAAEAAREEGLGVWAADRTATGFVPTPDALAVDGALVYPKFFRRVADWREPREDADAFLRWLRRHPDGQKLVQGAERDPLPLWRLFEKLSRTEVAVPYDVSRLWFEE